MKEVAVSSRAEWRAWLERHHDREPQGIWLVFWKKAAGRPTLDYDEAVEEALCFGWIDSIIKKLDGGRYVRKFTPRQPGSGWSPSNKARVARAIAAGRMTGHGQAKIDAAKKSGVWDAAYGAPAEFPLAPEFAAALARDAEARRFFATLAPTYQRQYLGWIATAKRPETRARRVAEAIALLGRGEKLGLK